MAHIYDNKSLTFAEMKEILSAATEGKLEKVTEKLDGMNSVFTYDVSEGDVRFARSGGDIANGGMDAEALSKKFFGRGNIEDAFNKAFKVLRSACRALAPNLQKKVFGAKGNTWYSVEIIYTANPGTISYDNNNIVFHGAPVFAVDSNGKVSRSNESKGVEILTANVQKMQSAVEEKGWQVRGPSLVALKKISDGSVLQRALSEINSAMGSAGVSDSNTIYDYLRALMSDEVKALELPEDVSDALVEYCVGSESARPLNDIKKLCTEKNQQTLVSTFARSSESLLKKFSEPLEDAIFHFSVEVLRGLNSTLIADTSAEVNRIKSQVEKTIAAANSIDNQTAADFVAKQMSRIGDINNISSAMEGVVFIWNGQAYKFTGNFQYAHSICSLFRYGRAGVPPMKLESVQNKGTTMTSDMKKLKSVIGELVQEHTQLQRLFEAPGGAGEEFESMEVEARKKYDDAVASLEAWKANDRKKQEFNKKYQELRSQGVSEKKAKEQLKANPKTSYDVKLAQKAEKTLEADKDKAEGELSAFDPEVRDYVRNKKGGARGLANKQLPEKGKKKHLDINKVKGMTWLPWPEAVKKSGISYGSKAAGIEGEGADAGVGPGEEWLAYVFGGQMQGGGVSYDVVTPDGSTWEVKQLLTRTETIRPGTEGLKAFEEARTRLVNIMNQLRDFVETAKGIGLTETLSDNVAKKINFIEEFVTDEYEMIVAKGEISKDRFIDLRASLITINKIKQALDLHKSASKGAKGKKGTKPTVSLNDKKVAVDKNTFIDIANIVKKATGDEDILSGIEQVEIAMSPLRDSAFDDAKGFFNDWFASIKLENVFSQVDGGLFVVHPNGFMMIPKGNLNSALKFEKVTQGKPRFSLPIFGAGPTGAKADPKGKKAAAEETQ
jgi:hypothetical protein